MLTLSELKSVLHINEKGGKFGGTEEYIASLAKLLSLRGISSHLIYEHLHGNLSSDITSHRKIDGLGNRNGDSKLGKEVLNAVLEIAPDIVYLHNIFDSCVIESLNQTERKYLLFWYVHDHFPTCLTELRAIEDEENIVCYQSLSEACLSNIESGYCVKRHAQRSFSEQELLSRLELLKSLTLVDAVIVVSNFMKEILIKNLPEIEDNIYVLPRQVRPSKSNIEPQTKQSSVIVFSGRITREKGLHLLIESLSQVQIQEKIILKIAGVVENESYWLQCLELIKKAEERNSYLTIQYVGHLSYDEIDLLYTEADLVVVPSIWGEPLGAVAAEALRNGSAVIASNVGGIDTWVIHEETGLLVQPNDINALSQAITKLLLDENLRRNLANTGRKLIDNKFTAEEHLKALFLIVEEKR